MRTTVVGPSTRPAKQTSTAQLPKYLTYVPKAGAHAHRCRRVVVQRTCVVFVDDRVAKKLGKVVFGDDLGHHAKRSLRFFVFEVYPIFFFTDRPKICWKNMWGI